MRFERYNGKEITYVCDYCLEEILDRLELFRCEPTTTDLDKINVAFIHKFECFSKLREEKVHNNIYRPTILASLEIQDYIINMINNNPVHKLRMKTKILEMESKGWKLV